MFCTGTKTELAKMNREERNEGRQLGRLGILDQHPYQRVEPQKAKLNASTSPPLRAAG
jgi:hypothetical protein